MMHHTSWVLMAACTGATVTLVQQVAAAKSATEVGEIARAITVEIKSVSNDDVGSGILLQQTGDVYTVLTAAHVLAKGNNNLTFKTADGTVHRAISGSIKRSGNNLDLALVKFRSSNRYPLAKIGTSNSLQTGSIVYVAGFPDTRDTNAAGVMNFMAGKVTGKATRANKNGYSLIYSHTTVRGMSGGPVLNEAGELVAIHGQGDQDNIDRHQPSRNLGIVVENVGIAALTMGLQLHQTIADLPPSQPLNGADYLLAGNDKDDQGDFRGALSDYDTAITLDPKFTPAYNNRGTLKARKLNDPNGSLADYNTAITLDPQDAIAHYNRGALKDQILNDLNGALSDYNTAILLDPKYAIAFNNRATLKAQKLNEPNGALLDYNAAIILDPKDAYAYYNRATLKAQKLNDPNGALLDYNAAIILDPKNAYAYYNRGVLKAQKLNDPNGALSDYNTAIALDPKNSKAFNNRGNLKENQLNDPSGALSDYSMAIAIDPKNAKAYFNRGSLKEQKLNDLNGALFDYNMAVALDPENAVAYYTRGSLKELKLNDLKGALSDYNMAISLNPKYAYAYHNRGFVKKTRGDRAGAIQDFRQAAQLYRSQGKTEILQQMIDQLQEMGVAE